MENRHSYTSFQEEEFQELLEKNTGLAKTPQNDKKWHIITVVLEGACISQACLFRAFI